MAVTMLNKDQKKLLFRNAPADPLWVGVAHAVTDKTEAVPFKFDGLRFTMVFMHPSEYYGGDEGLAENAKLWADGYMPHPSARLIKFFRADATDDLFQPKAWKLTNRAGIFQMGQVLNLAWAQHQVGMPQTAEYFYMATDERLQRFYDRIFVKSSANGGSNGFKPIQESTGDFYGYRK